MNEKKSVKALYMISVAAKLSGVHPQTLRIYEREGLISPERTLGKTRLYSDDDVELVKFIQFLTQENGVNLAGVKMVIGLKGELESFKQKLTETEIRMGDITRELLEEVERYSSNKREALVKAPKKEIIHIKIRDRKV